MTFISGTLKNTNAKCALIPFITAGYPSIQSTIEALYVLDRKGATAIELGIPYTDALADGPIIQESSRIAINNGVYVEQVAEIVKIVSPDLKAPIIVFTYYNPVITRGIERFVKEISSAGAKGLIIPDLPLEEADYLIRLCTNFGIELILFVAPTSSIERIDAIISKSPGCIYLVSSHGVTGMREKIQESVNILAKFIKEKTNKFIMLGFGISNPAQAASISDWNIDGIVMGSAFVKKMGEESLENGYTKLGEFCSDIKTAIN